MLSDSWPICKCTSWAFAECVNSQSINVSLRSGTAAFALDPASLPHFYEGVGNIAHQNVHTSKPAEQSHHWEEQVHVHPVRGSGLTPSMDAEATIGIAWRAAACMTMTMNFQSSGNIFQMIANAPLLGPEMGKAL